MVEIGKLVTKVESWNPARAGGTFTYIDLSAVSQVTKRVTAPSVIESADAPSRARQLLKSGDVLVSTVRPNLNGVAQVPVELDGATGSTGFCVLRANDSILDSRYLFQWVKAPEFVSAMVKLATGASYPAVSDRIVMASKIPLPPLPEQRRIADILDRADDLRAKRRAALAKLDTLTQAVFLDIFGVSDNIPQVKLSDLALRITKGESPRWQGFEYQTDGALFVTSENVRQGELDIGQPKFVPMEFHQKLARSALASGDLLVNLVGASIGRSCLFRGYDGPANVNQAVGVVTLNRDLIDDLFASNFLASHAGQRLLLGNRVEAARANISLANLRELPIPLPGLALQQEFAHRARSVERIKAVCRAGIAELDALFASLQHRAFRGEL